MAAPVILELPPPLREQAEAFANGRGETLEDLAREALADYLAAAPEEAELNPLYWTRIVYRKRRFRLRDPIQVRVGVEDGCWVHEVEPLSILAYGRSRSASLNALRMEFAACWDLVAQEDDVHLTADARELKRKVLGMVESVEELP